MANLPTNVQRTVRTFLIEEELTICKIDIMSQSIDWRTDIIKILKDPSIKGINPKLRKQAYGYFLLGDELHKRDSQGLLLTCLGTDMALLMMAEVHEGICGAHQAGPKMRWLLHRHGYFWPSMLSNCIDYAKGCKACQRYGPLKKVPAVELHPVIKPWPFRGWAMDMIGEITPPSSKGYKYVVVITDYFTKWVEAKAFKTIKTKDLVDFLKEFIFIRFGIPETITVDQAPVCNGPEIVEFCEQFGVKLLNSTPYYAQANGQAESTNKLIKAGISKMIKGNPRSWADLLLDTLWAYRTSKRGAIGCTPYQLVFGHDAVIPAEINVHSARISRQNELQIDDYLQVMSMSNLDVENLRDNALVAITKSKATTAKVYNSKVRIRTFKQGDLVWKVRLPPNQKDHVFGKWTPNWEGPFKVVAVYTANTYRLQTLAGEITKRNINGRFLKSYQPTIWEKYANDIKKAYPEFWDTMKEVHKLE